MPNRTPARLGRLTARLRTLRRSGLDLCLGLTDREGRRLLADWRSPAAEPFSGATHANPMGLASRRRYRYVAMTRATQRLVILAGS